MALNPIEVDCHLCHSYPKEPCKEWAVGERSYRDRREFCSRREDRAASVDKLGFVPIEGEGGESAYARICEFKKFPTS